MKRVLLGFLVFAVAVCFSVPCFAKEKKIGYVDYIKVVNEYKKTLDYEKVLQAKGTKEEAKLEKKREKIEKMRSKLALLKEQEQEREREKLIDAEVDFQKTQRQIVSELKKESEEKRREIAEDIDEVIEDYGKKNKFDVILNKLTILYGVAKMDVTPAILKEANKRYKKAKR